MDQLTDGLTDRLTDKASNRVSCPQLKDRGDPGLCNGMKHNKFALELFPTVVFGQRPRRGQSPVEHRGNLSICPSIRTYVRPFPLPHTQGFISFGAYSDPNSLNPSNMAQI